jgi:hypothetical protein
LGDFSRIVRIYNRLATALVTFESLWFAQWKNRIEQKQKSIFRFETNTVRYTEKNIDHDIIFFHGIFKMVLI